MEDTNLGEYDPSSLYRSSFLSTIRSTNLMQHSCTWASTKFENVSKLCEGNIRSNLNLLGVRVPGCK